MKDAPKRPDTVVPRLRIPASTLIFYCVLAGYMVYLVHRVSTLPLTSWDESREVMGAFEAWRSGDWIGRTWIGSLDTWNLKPPFNMWALAGTFHFFGFSELTARLPSLVFGLATAALIYHFVRHLTATGYYGFHGLTSADVDPILVFFNTLSFVAIHMVFLEGRTRWLVVLGASVGLGFMTKSVVGLVPLGLVLPALLVDKRWEHSIATW